MKPKRVLLAVAALVISLHEVSAQTEMQMSMDPCFSPINYPVPHRSLMIMALPDFQSARYTRNCVTGMLMLQYGITSRWTA